MNDGEDQTQRGSDNKSAEILDDVGVGSFDDNPKGASGTSSGLFEPVRGQVLDPLFDDFEAFECNRGLVGSQEVTGADEKGAG